jgi:probable phosphoglycerate mutase
MAANASELWTAPGRRRFYLMRHGDVDYFDAAGRPFRPSSVPLNAEGRRQAGAAGRELAVVPFDAVLTSGLPRSDQTAECVIAGRSLTIVRYPGLREIETGRLADLAGMSPTEVTKAFLGSLDEAITPETRFLGGETFGDLQRRVDACLAGILADAAWRNLLIVAHGVVNRVLLAHFLGAELRAAARLEQDPACINVIDVDADGRFLVRVVNHTPLNPLKVGETHSTMERLFLQYLRGRGE